MNTYLVAIDNKLTGEKGVLGAVQWTQDFQLASVEQRAAIFPTSIASRAKFFRYLDANSISDLEARFGRIQ